MESQPQNPEFRNNPENFHPCVHIFNSSTECEVAVVKFISYLPKKFRQMFEQTMKPQIRPEGAVWSGSTLFNFFMLMLCIPANNFSFMS